MAVIKPFKGIRYSDQVPAANVITPPYDVIGAEMQEELYKRSPYNFIRLEHGKTYPSDSSNRNRYRRAKIVMDRWLSGGILRPDSEPLYYIYIQEFSYEGKLYKRRSLVTALQLEPFNQGTIYPHESTFAGPKKDRLQLLKETESNLSPIMALFPDPDFHVDRIFAEAEKDSTTFLSFENEGLFHHLLAIRNKEMQDKITAALRSKSLLIADGHHRYETALNYFQNQAETSHKAGSSYILAALCSSADPGLLILPAHRLLSGLDSERIVKLEEMIEEHFESKPLLQGKGFNSSELKKILEAENQQAGIVYLTAERNSLLTARAADKSDLSVTLLHDLLLSPLLSENEKKKPLLTYSQQSSEAVRAVQSGEAYCAFLLEAPSVEAVLNIAQKGRLLPEKATYFYPKLPGGLVFCHHRLSY